MPKGVFAPSYFFLEDAPMQAIDRLIAAGMAPGMAFDTVYCFLQQNNTNGLERYVCKIERWQRQRPNDG